MKNPFPIGHTLLYTHTVTEADTARFAAGEVHPVYATFALARDAEWSGRLFVLAMKEAGEEGIGTALTIEHLSPAGIGTEVRFEAVLTAVAGNEVSTSFTAFAGERILATGTQKQKIVSETKLQRLFDSLVK